MKIKIYWLCVILVIVETILLTLKGNKLFGIQKIYNLDIIANTLLLFVVLMGLTTIISALFNKNKSSFVQQGKNFKIDEKSISVSLSDTDIKSSLKSSNLSIENKNTSPYVMPKKNISVEAKVRSNSHKLIQ